MNIHSKNSPFYAFVIAFFIIMIAPYLLSHGMFMDGLIYATVSNNLANGFGSAFDLAFSETIELHFREHPPLAFWLQSLFYKVFGDSYVIEKLYSALTYLITGVIIVKIWYKISNHKDLAWLPLLFWVGIPIITQAARNNLLENTMMVFTALAFFFLIDLQKHRLTKIIAAGLMIYLGFMTKGFVALFIWSAPVWWFVFTRKNSFKQVISNTGLLILFSFLPFVVASLIFPDSYTYMQEYFEKQVANSLLNVQTVPTRFWILFKLLNELITPLLLIGLTYLLGRLFKTEPNEHGNHHKGIAILFIALSGVLPIVISLKQSGFYFIPSLVFFALSFASLVESKVAALYQKINVSHVAFKTFSVISYSAILIGLIIVINNAGSNGRDNDKLTDINLVAEKIGKQVILESSSDVTKDWASISYFYRYYQISLQPKANPSTKYYVSLKELNSDHYHLVKLNLSYLKLYEQP